MHKHTEYTPQLSASTANNYLFYKFKNFLSKYILVKRVHEILNDDLFNDH